MRYKLSIKKKQLIIVIHVLSVVCWLGGAMCMLLPRHLYAEGGERGAAVLHARQYASDRCRIHKVHSSCRAAHWHCIVRLDELGAIQVLLDLDQADSDLIVDWLRHRVYGGVVIPDRSYRRTGKVPCTGRRSLHERKLFVDRRCHCQYRLADLYDGDLLFQTVRQNQP